MEQYKAEIIEESEKHFLRLCAGDKALDIPLTEDNPNAVKAVFNELILLLKKGEFEFSIEDTGGDLFSQVSNEYITQLNKDLAEVFIELEHYDLIEHKAD